MQLQIITLTRISQTQKKTFLICASWILYRHIKSHIYVMKEEMRWEGGYKGGKEGLEEGWVCQYGQST